MTFQLPHALQADDDGEALTLLRRYYHGSLRATGALFDTWDTTGTRGADIDRFTADDVVAITTLSVRIGPEAAHELLVAETDCFHELLQALGPDRDLVDEDHELDDEWPGWAMMEALKGLPGVGPTTASKLLARKRPRLRPIWDQVVAGVVGGEKLLWDPLRVALRENEGALHHRLLGLRATAELPGEVSALRVFDVICWQEGKDRGLRDEEEID